MFKFNSGILFEKSYCTYIEAQTFLIEEFSKIHSADRKLINIYIKGKWPNFAIYS